MKKFVCETCGSSSLLKQDGGLYICEYCRTKYTIEEAKKLFVEVSINHDKEVEEMYVAANRALNNKNWDTAYNLFKKILSYCPNDWEAIFYTALTRALTDGRTSFPHSVVSLSKAIKESMNILKNETNNDSLKEPIDNISSLILNLCTNYYIETKRTEKHAIFDSAEAKQSREPIYTACIELSYFYGDVLNSSFGDRYKDLILTAWKQGVTWQNNSQIEKCQLGTASDYEKKIQKYDPNWSFKANGKKEVRKGEAMSSVLLIIAIIAVIYSFVNLSIPSALMATGFIFVAYIFIISNLWSMISIGAIFAILVSLTKLPSNMGWIVALLICVVWYFIHKYLKKKENENAVDI